MVGVLDDSARLSGPPGEGSFHPNQRPTYQFPFNLELFDQEQSSTG
jgi:hypothetical protein